MKPIEQSIQDGMPREVATSILSEPKAALSNRWRKACMRAREKVFVSSSPIRRMPAINEAGEIIKGWVYTENTLRTPEDKTARRFGGATLAQLDKWKSRAIKRRVVVQREFLAVLNSDVPAFQARFDTARQLLTELANKLDIIRDCAEDEIAARKAKCDSVEAVRHMFKSVVLFTRKDTV